MPGDQVSYDRQMLAVVARELGTFAHEMLFVGGHVAELLVTTPGVTRVRPTTDVDTVVSATTGSEYREIEKRLRELGFRHDTSEGAPICRWQSPAGIALDVMPMDESILGFSNRWYPQAMELRVPFELTHDLTITIPLAPLFLAMKWDAVDSRAAGELRTSHDMEDIINVVTGRSSILREIGEMNLDVSGWLAEKAGEFLDHPDTGDALAGALPDAGRIPDLIPTVVERFEKIRDRLYE